MLYVKLMLLKDLTFTGEQAADRERWLNNLRNNWVFDDGCTVDQDEDGNYAPVELSDDEVEENFDVVLYNFIGGPCQQESFYARPDQVYKHLVTGDYYVVDTGELDIF